MLRGRRHLFWPMLAMVAVMFTVIASSGAQAAGLLQIVLQPQTGPPTSTAKVRGFGFPASDNVTIRFDSIVVAVATANTSGGFVTPFTVPKTATPGLHDVSAFDNAGVGKTAIFVVAGSWTQGRYDSSGGGFNRFENVLSPANIGGAVPRSAPQWGGNLSSEPIYVGGDVIAGSSDGTVREFNALNGNEVWSFRTGGPVQGSPIAVIPKAGAAPCAIVAAAIDGRVYGIDQARGVRLWMFMATGPISGSPISFTEKVGTSTTQRVVVIGGDGGVTSFDGCTGAVNWGALIGLSPVPNETAAYLPAVQLPDGTTRALIIVVFPDRVEALDATTGASVWVATGVAPTSSPTVFGSGKGARIVFGAGSTAVELNASNGHKEWSTFTDGSITGGLGLYETPVPGSTKFAVQGIVAGQLNGGVQMFNPKTGSLVWVDHNIGGGPISSITIANGVAYFTAPPSPLAGGMLIGLDVATGTKLFQADLGALNSPVPQPAPIVADGLVLTGDFTGGLRVFGLPA